MLKYIYVGINQVVFTFDDMDAAKNARGKKGNRCANYPGYSPSIRVTAET